MRSNTSPSIINRYMGNLSDNTPPGSYIPLNPSLMRNRWFPARIADYVPATQLKQLKLQDVDLARDFSYGVRVRLEEAEEEELDVLGQPQRYVRPIAINVLSVCSFFIFTGLDGILTSTA